MTVPARLFCETLWDQNVWYLDCPRVPNFVRKRRVALVIDTTDSCWTGPPEAWIRDVLEDLDRRLEPDDRCTLWLLGPRDPVSDLVRGPHPQQLAARILSNRGLRPYERGSWLHDTVVGIDSWSRGAPASEYEDYLLILTDGEIHDGGVEPLPSAIPPERIAMILPPVPPGTPRQPATAIDPGAWGSVQIRWSGSLARLDRTQPLIQLLPGAVSPKVYRYDQTPIDLVAGTLDVQPRERLALCFIGGQKPAPGFLVGSDTVALSNGTAPQTGCPGDAQAQQMRRIVRLLLAPWDREALSGLIASQSVIVTHCGRQQPVDRGRPPNEQPCACECACGGSLLVQEQAFVIGVEDQDKALLFLMLPDGTIAKDLPLYRPAFAVSESSCYGVHVDEMGRRFLVLKFLPKVF